eukprot:g3673.t1
MARPRESRAAIGDREGSAGARRPGLVDRRSCRPTPAPPAAAVADWRMKESLRLAREVKVLEAEMKIQLLTMAQGKLKGLVTLVTGASSGIGKATAIAFSNEGAKVVMLDRQEEKLHRVADKIKLAGGEAIALVGDVTKEDDCKNLVDTAVEEFGGLHVAFNNAGLFRPTPFADVTDEAMNALLGVHVKSLAWGFKHQIPAMAATAGGQGSIIVNTSCSAMRPMPSIAVVGGGMYSASKAAAEMLTKYAAIEGASLGVRVNSVVPGQVETSIVDITHDELVAASGNYHLIKRPIQPEEVAKVVVFLASEDAAAVTGSSYAVDCGFNIKA